MPNQLPVLICPKCLHQFEYGGNPKACRWCNKSFHGNGNRRYCNKVCKVKANNWRLWQRLKTDKTYVEKKRKYMREYMRTYPGPPRPRVRKEPDGV